jgi:hypothetical protein
MLMVFVALRFIGSFASGKFETPLWMCLVGANYPRMQCWGELYHLPVIVPSAQPKIFFCILLIKKRLALSELFQGNGFHLIR